MRKINEECGVFGLISQSPTDAVGITASALLALQHRGQEGAGIATFAGNELKIKKNVGLVSEVFTSDYLCYAPRTNVAVGHVRYSTTGGNTAENVQPIETVHSRLTCALAHNGNITNAAEIRHRMIYDSGKVFHTTNDSEIINMLIVDEMIKQKNLERAVYNAVNAIEGAFSLIIATADRLIAVRDPSGFRPLCIGKKDGMTIFASESCAIDAMGAEFIRDVMPGELVSVDKKGEMITMRLPAGKLGLCVFEMIYIARPDSVIDGMSVHSARLEMGKALYRQRPIEADVVCGVPDSGLDAAYGFSRESGIPLAPAFVKNKYVGRSFIIPSQTARENAVRVKLNPLRAAVEGKRIVLVDDSIVRGTTSARIIKSLRDAGAKEIHMRVSSPPFRHPCHFGVDVDSEENLIANKMSISEICSAIGADSLEYLSLENLNAITLGTTAKYCDGCFTGKYPVCIYDRVSKDRFDD